MKELPEFHRPSKAEIQKNWEALRKNTCGCRSCSVEFNIQAENHLMTAPIHEIKFIKLDVLKEDVRRMQRGR